LTIAFLPIERLWATRFEASLDRGMVGEAESQAVPRKLPLLRRPGARRLDDLEVALEQVIYGAGVGRTIYPEALAQCPEGGGALGGSQVEVTAEEQRRVSRPLGRGLSGAQYVRRCQIRPVVGRVQICDAEVSAVADPDTRKRHRPSLRSPGVDRQLPPLHDHAAPVCLFPLTGG
jgi:hypothetical protein